MVLTGSNPTFRSNISSAPKPRRNHEMVLELLAAFVAAKPEA